MRSTYAHCCLILADKCYQQEDGIKFTEHLLHVTYCLDALPTLTIISPIMLVLRMRKLCLSHVKFLAKVSQLINGRPGN